MINQDSSVGETVIEKGKDVAESFKEKFNLSDKFLIDLFIYLGVGFLTGFILKRWGKIIALVILVFLGIGLLQQFELVSFDIHWSKIQELIGAQGAGSDLSSIINYYAHWMKDHLVYVFIFGIGFLIGLKIG